MQDLDTPTISAEYETLRAKADDALTQTRPFSDLRRLAEQCTALAARLRTRTMQSYHDRARDLDSLAGRLDRAAARLEPTAADLARIAGEVGYDLDELANELTAATDFAGLLELTRTHVPSLVGRDEKRAALATALEACGRRVFR